VKRTARFSPLIFCTLVFLTGITMGAMSLRVLSVNEKAELVSYLEVFMRGLRSPGLEPGVVFRLSLAQNLKTAALVWAFGLSIIGAPLTCVMLIIRGFALGFAASFIVSEVSSGGTLMFMAGMLPQNIVAVPATVLLAAFSLSFSLVLFRERPWTYGGLWSKGGSYTWRCLVLASSFVVASLVEAYISPMLLMKIAGA
jgi:stage II sporulation protein M